jgi:CelD/BcsL family acetyltransferase involved in cellulose biosynthesis
MTDIRVEIRSSATDIAGDWNDLLTRAPANAFLDPAGLSAVFETGYAKVHILLAWERSAAGERLVGVWGLEEKRLTPFGPRYLSTPPHFYALIGSPVVDPARDAETMDAFFAAIASDPRLPKTIRLKYLDGDSPVHAPTMRALGAHAREITEPLVRERPFVTREQGVKRSGSTRKKLRQDWNRLAALGATDYANDRAPAAVVEGFETFLALEEASWKGENGTALLCDEKDAAFTRRFIAGMAAAGKASVALLRVDGKPIAAQVLLYCGTFAYTWKIAYSADYGKYSPGAVLVDKVTEDLFANGTEAIESCSPEGGFMVQMWEGRRRTVDLLASVAPGKSLAFRAVLFRDRGVAELKRIRDRLRTLQWRPKKKIAVPAVAKTAS